ncbi:MAG: TIGR00645 family protein [Hyphomicrobiales bacterium]|nr:TIGR00645 family protein [Hyphomicrobiales bacterium]
MSKLPRLIQTTLFSTRWLLAPFYFGLVLGLLALLFKLVQHAWHMATHLVEATESAVTLDLLSLIDMTLVGSLIVIVIFSGYENFVSPLDDSQPKAWPEWMGKIDFTGLKLKLMSSIVAISAIQLLRSFMDIDNESDRDLAWATGIHLAFILSALLLALSDKLSVSTHSDAGH